MDPAEKEPTKGRMLVFQVTESKPGIFHRPPAQSCFVSLAVYRMNRKPEECYYSTGMWNFVAWLCLERGGVGGREEGELGSCVRPCDPFILHITCLSSFAYISV